ncbi:MAG: aromatic ring-hydroxylating dioxygenase subunit alpha, partial [Proteobacteria bacterium]|nr:aromatic ring-hydroxylating dioxygenase subunit alpha [Pseudomonadota bacterium]
QTAHRSYEEQQDNPGDWEAWSSQGPMNVHRREYLGTTDEGIALLRTKLKKDIRAVGKGKKLSIVEGSESSPVNTYGGDTILRMPPDAEDDRSLMKRLINEVFDLYRSADRLDPRKRRDYVTRELAARYPGAV